MRTELFGTSGDRDFVQNIAIVVTDGQSTIQRFVQNIAIVVTDGQSTIQRFVQNIAIVVTDGQFTIRNFVQNIINVVTDGQSTIRRFVQNIAIVVTDGQYQFKGLSLLFTHSESEFFAHCCRNNTIPEALLALDSGITILAVGVGDTTEESLQELAVSGDVTVMQWSITRN